jgi:hypothetical protein
MAKKSGGEKLPLPSFFVEEDDDNDDCVDEPSKHQGKIRNFGHVRGNWPTHVYLPVTVGEEFQACIDRFRCHVGKAWQPCDTPLHISVSRTVPIKYHWIEPMSSALRAQLSTVNKFEYSLGEVSCYVNDEGTRSFLALDITSGHSKFCDVVRCVDKVFRSYGLPTFYKPASFHCSILWRLGNHNEILRPQELKELSGAWSDLADEEGCGLLAGFPANQIFLKTGNKLFSFELN